ncbi:dienelactone hydrolase family protein [Myxococcus qinghaiensis]|uniref:dienelactone hydrolase family protein n=1 Tax=Myxococcus qinghaiensis TaxID=2906758 RepID=UPI0020A74B90|nr:dienelactone hydrolase family protein [Myxococcus qinghaiensis]MCP3161543.1 dienelactone hydrolase family protein [Myxococcus qinghaiensis]
MEDIELPTREGTMDAKLFQPEGRGPWPAVILLTDAMGIRPAFEHMAQRLADGGYVVLLPNVFYREGRAGNLALQGSFADEAFRKHIFALIATLTPQRVRDDGAAELDFLAQLPQVKGPKVGVAGYCMSGSMAVRMAADFPDTVAAAVSNHGGKLATDSPDSAHLRVGDVRGELVFGHADQDGSMPADAILRLETALKTAGVRHQSHLHVGARHGYAVEGSGAYDKDAAEQHWRELFDVFGRTLSA